MATMEQLLAGEYGVSLHRHAEVKVRHSEELRQLEREIVLSQSEHMILLRAHVERALLSRGNETASTPTVGQAQLGRVMFEELTKGVSEAAKAHDARKAMLAEMAIEMLNDFQPMPEMNSQAAQGELSQHQLEEWCALGSKLTEKSTRFFIAPIDSMLMPHKGAAAKKAKNPIAIAKEQAKNAAEAIWPEANRRGWTAVQFHAALVKEGYEIAPDTARKWLTNLRKTGTC